MRKNVGYPSAASHWNFILLLSILPLNNYANKCQMPQIMFLKNMMFNVFLQSCICMIKYVFLNHTFYPWSTFVVILSSSHFLLLCVEQSECTFINHTCLLPIGVK